MAKQVKNGGLTRRTFMVRSLATGASVAALGSPLRAFGAGGKVTLQFWKFAAENDDANLNPRRKHQRLQ